MDKNKKERLEAKGWKVSNVEEFLDLTPEENAAFFFETAKQVDKLLATSTY